MPTNDDEQLIILKGNIDEIKIKRIECENQAQQSTAEHSRGQ